MRHQGETQLNREQRLNALDEILKRAEHEDKEYSKPELLAELNKSGYPIALPTLYKDLDELLRNDDFIVKLATTSYSSIMHESFKNYNKIFRLAMNIHDADSHLVRQVNTSNDKGESKQTIEDNSSNVKLQALTVAKNAQDSIRLMVNGENLHKSASKWVEVSKKQEATIFALKEQLKEYQEKPINTPETSKD